MEEVISVKVIVQFNKNRDDLTDLKRWSELLNQLGDSGGYTYHTMQEFAVELFNTIPNSVQKLLDVSEISERFTD